MFDIAAMERRLATIEAEQAHLRSMIDLAHSYVAVVGSVDRANPVGGQFGDIISRRIVRPRPAPIMQATEDLAAEMMEATGRPIKTMELVNEMAHRGLRLPEKNAINVISARLSNSPKFAGKRGRGWWFTDRPWPAEEMFDIVDPDDDPDDDVLQTDAADDQ